MNDTNNDAVQALRDIVAERVRAVNAKDPEPLTRQTGRRHQIGLQPE